MALLKHRISDQETRQGQAIELVRGDDTFYVYEHGALATELVRAIFTARKTVTDNDGDGTVVIQIDSDDPVGALQWTLTADRQATLDFIDSDTLGLSAANNELSLVYDIEHTYNDGTYETVETGTVTIFADQTHDDDTALYLSRSTRADLDAALEGYAAGLDRTFLSAAASAADTDIDVTNAAVFAAADDIRIILDDGTYTEVTIDTITDNNIDFSTSDPGGLASAASANNVVLKVV